MEEIKIKGKAATVKFENVSKVFNKNVFAVDNISLEIEAGTLVTLLGPSGCGKTTTLRMIAGLEIATRGRIFIGSKDVTSLPATDRDVSMVFQSYALFPHMTVIENVSYGLKFSGFNKLDTKSRAIAGLELVGLEGYEDRLPSELSGGQQQRVAVARALVLEPQVLLFDEPLSNLDAKLRRQVREEIREIQKKLELTVVYVTHDQEEALAVSDKIVVMNNAGIAQTGTPRELFEEPKNRFVADFIGEANLLSCIIEEVKKDTALVNLSGNFQKMKPRGLSPGPGVVAIRPNRIEILKKESSASMEGQIIKMTYVGNRMEYMIKTSFGDLFVISEHTNNFFLPDEKVKLVFNPNSLILLPPD